jgi:hypothetical protein
MNVYTYVHNNPINFVDPLGLWFWDADYIQRAIPQYFKDVWENAKIVGGAIKGEVSDAAKYGLSYRSDIINRGSAAGQRLQYEQWQAQTIRNLDEGRSGGQTAIEISSQMAASGEQSREMQQQRNLAVNPPIEIGIIIAAVASDRMLPGGVGTATTEGLVEGGVTAAKGGATFGRAASADYRATFFAANPELEGQVVVHHAVPQRTLKLYPSEVTVPEIHSLENLRGIPNSINSEVHLSQIAKEWNQFYKANPNATQAQLLQKATEIDAKYGPQFRPPAGGSR